MECGDCEMLKQTSLCLKHGCTIREKEQSWDHIGWFYNCDMIPVLIDRFWYISHIVIENFFKVQTKMLFVGWHSFRKICAALLYIFNMLPSFIACLSSAMSPLLRRCNIPCCGTNKRNSDSTKYCSYYNVVTALVHIVISIALRILMQPFFLHLTLLPPEIWGYKAPTDTSSAHVYHILLKRLSSHT